MAFFQLEHRSSTQGYGTGLAHTTALEFSMSAPRKSLDLCRQPWSSGDPWNMPGRIQSAENPSSSADPGALTKKASRFQG